MRVYLLTTTIAFALSVVALQPRQDLSDPAVASSIYTALSSSGPLSLSSLTSTLDAGFSTETGPINSVTAITSSPTPVAGSSSGLTSSVTMTDTFTDGFITVVPSPSTTSGGKRVVFDGLAITAVSLLFSAWMIL